MKAKERLRREREVRRILEKWLPILGLTNWKIIIRYVKNPDGAEVIVDYVYLRAKIWIHDNVAFDELEETVLHEVLHILISYHLRKYIMELYGRGRISDLELNEIRMGEEGLVETLARAFLKVEQGGDDELDSAD